MMAVSSRKLPLDMEKVHLTLNMNREEDSVYSEKEKCHQCLEVRDLHVLKVTSRFQWKHGKHEKGGCLLKKLCWRCLKFVLLFIINMRSASHSGESRMEAIL